MSALAPSLSPSLAVPLLSGEEDPLDVRSRYIHPQQKLMEEIDPRQPHPHHHAGFFGNLFFTWINPLFEAGLKAPIEPSQLYEVQKEKTLEYLDHKFQQFRQKHPNQQILANVYGMVRQEYMFATILFVCGSAFQMLAPVIFHYFYDEFKEKEDEFRENKHELKTPAILAGLLLVNLYIRTLVINHANYLISNCGSKVANTLKSLVFKKMVHIDLLHLDYFVDTTLVNLLTVDMDHLTYGLTILPNILAAFAVFALQFVFLYSIGYLTLALVLLLILWILLLRALHSQTKAAKHKLAKDSDAGSRVLKGLVLDCVNIKLNHYEPVIYRELIRHKEKESTIYKTYLKWSQMANLMTFIFPTLFGYIYFGLSIYTTQGTKDISLVDTYLVLTVLSILKTPLSLVNEALDKYPEYAVSSSRIQTFLEKILERKLALNGHNNEVKQTKTDVEKSEILLQGCSFGFNTSKTSSQMTATNAPEASSKGSEGPLESVPEAAAQEEDGQDQAEGVQQDVPPTSGDQKGDKETDFHEKERPALGGQVLPAASAAQKKEANPVPLVIVDISLHISAGDRLALFGPAGSGKTFLLQSLLGETQLHSGKMIISGSTGYYPEEGIFSEDSILQNIVCGRDFDLDRYQKALRLALLDQYIDKVHDKDGFILKNNAGNLYYKLRKRIMIARMLYDIPDIVIFDGFLDDQDSEYRQHVCQVIFGRESNNLKADGSPVTLIVSTDREDVCKMVNRVIVLRDGRLVEEGIYSRLIRNKRGLFAMMLEKDVDALPQEDKTELKVIEEDPRESKEIARETVEEERISIEAWQKSSDQTSSVQVNFPKKVTFSWGAVLTIFFLNAGFLWPLSYLFFMVLSQIVIYSFTWLLAAWKAGKFLDSIEPYEYVIFYGGIMLTGLMAQWVTGVIFIRYFRRISFRLYVMIIRSLVSKNLDWYRAVSPSKILNACVTDYHEVDQLLGPSFNSFLQYFVKVNVGAILICYKTWLGGPLILILHCWLVFIITKRFLPVDRSLKQIMASNRSHMITTIMDAHKGILHYRNSGLIGHALENFKRVHDIFYNSKSADTNYAVRWLSTRLLAILSMYPVLVLGDALLCILMDWQLDVDLMSLKFTISCDVCFGGLSLINYLAKNETYYSDIMKIRDTVLKAESNMQKGSTVEDKSLKSRTLTLDARASVFFRELGTRPGEDRMVPVEPEPEQLTGQGEQEAIVSFDRVTALYPSLAQTAINNLSFTVSAGEKVAFAGVSGSGKHTVLDLLSGVSSPSLIVKGSVKIFGVPLHKRGGGGGTKVIRETLGEALLLTGEFHLVEGELRSNIDPLRMFTDWEILETFDYLGYWDTPDSYIDERKRVPELQSVMKANILGETLSDKTNLGRNQSARPSFHKEDSVFSAESQKGKKGLRPTPNALAMLAPRDQFSELREFRRKQKQKLSATPTAGILLYKGHCAECPELSSSKTEATASEEIGVAKRKGRGKPIKLRETSADRAGSDDLWEKIVKTSGDDKGRNIGRVWREHPLAFGKNAQVPLDQLGLVEIQPVWEFQHSSADQVIEKARRQLQFRIKETAIVSTMAHTEMEASSALKPKEESKRDNKSRYPKSVNDELNEHHLFVDLGDGRDFDDQQLIVRSPLRKKIVCIKENSEVTEDDKIMIRNRIVDFRTGAILAGHNLPLLVRNPDISKLPKFVPNVSYRKEMKADRLQKLTKLLSSKVIGGAAGLTPLKMVLIQIGRALLLKPKVLIVGSTFLNMEEIYRNLFLTVILRNLDSSAVLVIGDNLKQHEQYFDKIIHLHRGMISKIVTQQ